MQLKRLALTAFRNYRELEFTPMPGLNVFVGANAQGKSNLLEAIGLLATGKSFRTARESETIAHGAGAAAVAGEALVRAGTVRLSCTITAGAAGTRKRYTLNGRAVRYLAYLGSLRVVSFVPSDLQLVTGPPALRRSLLNAALSQESATYYAALAEYNRFLTQKNALLRGAVIPDETLLRTYNEQLITSGSRLIVARAGFVLALHERAGNTYARWAPTGDGSLELRYAPNIAAPAFDEGSVAEAFSARLRSQREVEAQRGVALVGPHRDDLLLSLGGRPLAAFGSQGQQRAVILALKLAEYTTAAERSGEAPLLLLDDVLSELDTVRQRALLDGVASAEQAFITTTTALSKPLGASYRIADGRIEAAA